MHFTGSAEFVAGEEHVWSFLIDPSRLGPCSPVPIERVDDRHYRAEAKLGAGMFGMTVRVDLAVTDVDAGRRATIVGRAGASGTTIDGRSSFSLRRSVMEGTTIVDWDVEFTISGLFAGAAANVIAERAPQAIDRLLGCIHHEIEG